MKNYKRNWYKIGFILSCIVWGLFVAGVLVHFFKPNETNEPENQNLEIEAFEEDVIYYSPAETYAVADPIPFFEISDADRYTIECIVAGEAKGESFVGMKLVAQCIMNAMIRNDWDAETVRVEYQYSGWDPDLENSNSDVWTQIELAVSEVFDEGNLETYEPILYFYAPAYSSGSWHENNLEYVLTEGGHRFFKLKGE